MSKEPRRTNWWRAALCGALLAAGCVTDDGDGHHSFTWVDGWPWRESWQLIDTIIRPGAPLLILCTPHAFAACQGDAVLACNAAGDDYDLTPCEHGCDIEAGGCNPAEPPAPGEGDAQATRTSGDR